MRFPFFLITVIGLLSTACSPIEEQRGHVMEDSALKQVVIGVSGEADVRAVLGSPSTVSDFGEPTWYYIRSRSEQTAFFRPKIMERKITKVTFDSNGTVRDITHSTLEDGQKIADVKETTPTEGEGLGFIEQMLSNMGRFNAPGGRR